MADDCRFARRPDVDAFFDRDIVLLNPFTTHRIPDHPSSGTWRLICRPDDGPESWVMRSQAAI
jgi:hypothetical protein